MNKDLQKPPLSWALISVFVIVSAVVIVSGILFTDIQKKHLKTDKEDELNAYADLKVAQIEQWRNERLADALLIQDNLSLVDNISDFLYRSDNFREKNKLLAWMKSITTNYDYFSAIIIDKGGRARLGLNSADSLIGSFLRPLIPVALSDKKVILTDLHRAHKNGTVHLDLIIPLIKNGIDVTTIGLVVLRIDPSKVLFRSVQSWPTKSRSSETLLLRRDGDSVIYLNELKHLSNTALNLKRAISDTNFIGTRAVKGFTGIMEGFDYRNVPVLAVIKAVPGTPWFMISKVDKQEITSQLNSQQLIIRLLIIFIISAFGAVIGWMIWHQRVRFYKNRYEAEAEKMALRTHFDYLLKYANDLVLLMSEDLRIVEANDRAIEVYQFTRDEIIGMDVRTLRIPEELDKLEEMLSVLRETGSTTYETFHRKKDGSVFPIEISARLFEIEGVKYYQSIGRDITDRKRIESNMNALLERYNLATEAAMFAVWDWDIVNDVLLWDDRVYELFGVKKNEVLPVFSSWLKILHPDDVEKAKKEIESAIKGESKYDTEFRVIHPDGEIKYIKGYGQIVKGKNGLPARMIGINFDISEQKIADKLLREREFWLSESQRVGKIGSYIFDIKTMLWTSSEVLDGIFGIDHEYSRTMVGWNNIVHPENRDEMLDYVKNYVIFQKKPFDKEYKIINQNTGKEIWVHGKGELSFDTEGNPARLIGTVQDITLSKNAEIELAKSLSLLMATIESTADGILVVDTIGKIVMYNRKFSEMWRIPQDVLDKRNDDLALDFVVNQLIEPDSFMNNVRFLYSAPEKISNDILEFKDGRVFERYSQPQKINDSIAGRVWSFRDITQKKSYEEQLIKAKEKAEESDRLKTAFLHNISHEIRTPMNAIVGFTALLDEPGLDADSRKQFINIITQSTNQLLSIISDIVDVSNIETNQVKLNISEVNINTIIKDLYDQFKITADQQKLLFFYEVKGPDKTSVLNTDKTKLVQILSNLLSNSFKFTKQGTVQFGYYIKNNCVEFYVNDTGIGVPEDKKLKIFDRFYQIENNSSRQYSGAGLGLSICKAYVEILGGSIWVDSKPGSGSSFHFTVPL
jgi:PAS domain S-box-containing protein